MIKFSSFILLFWVTFFTSSLEQCSIDFTKTGMKKNDGFIFRPSFDPKTVKDIDANLRYDFGRNVNIKKSHSSQIMEHDHFGQVAQWYMQDNPKVFITKITKIYNYSKSIPYDYNYLVEIGDKAGKVYMIYIMDGRGHFLRSSQDINGSFKSLWNNFEIINCLAQKLGKKLANSDVKKVEFIFSPTRWVSALFPAARVVLKSGEAYYLTFSKKKLYKVSKKIASSELESNFSSNEIKSARRYIDFTQYGYYEEITAL